MEYQSLVLRNAFADRVFTLMLVYMKQFLEMQEFSHLMQYLLAANSTDNISGEFSYDLLEATFFLYSQYHLTELNLLYFFHRWISTTL